MKYFLLFLPATFLSCSSPEYGPDFNPERVKRGVPIIEEGWSQSIHSEAEYLVWGDGKLLDENRTYHIRKYLYLKGEFIQKENDAFVKKVNDTLSYELLTQYYFVNMKERWNCILNKFGRNRNYELSSVPITLVQADSILASWGLSRTGK